LVGLVAQAFCLDLAAASFDCAYGYPRSVGGIAVVASPLVVLDAQTFTEHLGSASFDIALTALRRAQAAAGRDLQRRKMRWQGHQERLVQQAPHASAEAQPNPVWTSDPKRTLYRDVGKRRLTIGALGSVGEKAASALADFGLVDTFASFCAGREHAKGAMKLAERRLQRIYC
jgi:hypothetical protein